MEISNLRSKLIITAEELAKVSELGLMEELADLILNCSGEFIYEEKDCNTDDYTDEDLSIMKMYKTLIDSGEDSDWT